MATNSLKAPKVIMLAGPTGSGKTGAALRLARLLAAKDRPASVVNADSRQLYRDFPIITAQPSHEERTVCPHLLYGYLETGRKSTAWEWAGRARREIESLLGREEVPLVVGGTGMYLKTLTDGMALIPEPDPEVGRRLLRECEEEGSRTLHRRLEEADPASAARIHPNDRQRVIRALEVWESTGKPLGWWHTHHQPGPEWDVLRLGIGLPLPELEPRLGLRIEQMIEAGAPEEARLALKSCPDTSLPGWTGIGCAELAAFLENRISLEQCLADWRHHTRAYAKRQWTWFRADTRLTWFRPEELDAIGNKAMSFLEL